MKVFHDKELADAMIDSDAKLGWKLMAQIEAGLMDRDLESIQRAGVAFRLTAEQMEEIERDRWGD
jgi:hypothetical protein